MELTREQEIAANHQEGPGLVLAIPGSGKTTMMLARAHRLIDEGVNPERIVTITFSRASALDMKARDARQYGPSKSWFSTIHSLSYQILRDWDRRKGRSHRLLGSDGAPFAFQVYEAAAKRVLRTKPTEEERELFLNELTYMKNRRLSLEEFAKSDRVQSLEFMKIATLYEEMKRRDHLIDFDDMLLLAVEALEEDGNFLKQMRGKMDFLQLDEAQDTSPLQFQLLEKLLDRRKNLFLVADDDQSIYGFRGADPGGLQEFTRRHPEAPIYRLQENFRSTGAILDLAGRVIEKNKERFSKTLHTNRHLGQNVQLLLPRERLDEYDAIVEEIKKNPRPSTAILLRKKISTVGVVLALEEAKIPFQIGEGKLKSMKGPMLWDFLAAYDLALEPDNVEALTKIYYKIKGYLSKKQLAYARSHPMKNAFDAMAQTPGLPWFQQKGIYEIKGDFRYMSRLAPGTAFHFFLTHLKYDEYLEEASKRWAMAPQDIAIQKENLAQVFGSCRNRTEIDGKLQWISDIGKGKGTEDVVVVDTMHGAKGREFDRVFLVDLCDGIIPTSFALSQEIRGHREEMEEERRLFYVALTRARDELFLLAPREIGSMEQEMCRFLREILPNSGKETRQKKWKRV